MSRPMKHEQLLENIARVCHEAVRTYCEINALTMPMLQPWGTAPTWVKVSAMMGVQAILDDPESTPEDNHRNWCAHKVREGWIYGPVKDDTAKTHPCLVPYLSLPADQRAKDVLFVNIVRALMPMPAPLSPKLMDKIEAVGREAMSGPIGTGGDPNTYVVQAKTYGEIKGTPDDPFVLDAEGFVVTAHGKRVITGQLPPNDDAIVMPATFERATSHQFGTTDEERATYAAADARVGPNFDPAAPITFPAPSGAEDTTQSDNIAALTPKESEHGKEQAEQRDGAEDVEAGAAAQADGDGKAHAEKVLTSGDEPFNEPSDGPFSVPASHDKPASKHAPKAPAKHGKKRH